MAIVQDTYLAEHAVGVAGQIANGETSNRISRTVEGADGLGFGKAAFRGAGDHGCTATPADDAFLGLSIATYAAPADADGVQADLYTEDSTAGILTQGVIWVIAGGAVTAGAAAYATDAGAIVATATDNTALTGWSFDTDAADGALVKLAKR